MANNDAAILFFAYAVTALLVFGFSARLGLKRLDLPGFVCTPIACLTLVFENVVLGIEFLTEDLKGMSTVLSTRFVVHSLIAPLFIISCFELGYQVHKKRGVNYCCIRFEEGHRNQSDVFAQMLRFFPWVLAAAVGAVSLVANVDYVKDPLTPRSRRFANEALRFDSTEGLSDFMDFLPSLVLVGFAAYAGGSLWKYGTYYAMEVHATTVNPWVFLFAAALCQLGAGLATPTAWAGPYLTNAAELMLAMSVVHATYQVDMNLEEIREFGGDLEVTNKMSKVIQKHNRREQNGGSATPGSTSGVVATGAVDLEIGPRRKPRRAASSRMQRVSRQAGMAVVAARRAKHRVARRNGKDAGGTTRAAKRVGSGRRPRRPPSQRSMHTHADDDAYSVGSDEGSGRRGGKQRYAVDDGFPSNNDELE